MYFKPTNLVTNILTISAVLLFNSFSLAQKTDVVILNNGDKLTGEVKNLLVGILTFKTDNMETVSIQWDKIKSVETKNFFEVEVSDGRVFFGSIYPSGDEGMLVVKGVTLDNNLFMKYIVRINRIKESFWDMLDGSFNLGFSFTKASKVGQVNMGMDVNYRTKIYLLALTLNSIITTTAKEPTSSKNDLSFSYQLNLANEWFAAGIASLQENSELGIKLRTSLGGGIGNNLIQSQRQWLYALAGVSVNREEDTDQSEPIFNIEGLINVQYQLFKYDHPKANLLTYIYLFPSLSDLGRFRFNYNFQLSWEIFIDFYWDLTFYFDYDNSPQSQGASQSDYSISNSIKFVF